MKHKPVKHDNCNELGCPICDGGLFVCEVCGLIEGSLTTDCSGEESFLEYNQDVYNGLIDFKDGVWVKEVSPHSPASLKL